MAFSTRKLIKILGGYAKKGFRFQYNGEDQYSLRYKGECVGLFQEAAVTEQNAQRACRTILKRIGKRRKHIKTRKPKRED